MKWLNEPTCSTKIIVSMVVVALLALTALFPAKSLAQEPTAKPSYSIPIESGGIAQDIAPNIKAKDEQIAAQAAKFVQLEKSVEWYKEEVAILRARLGYAMVYVNNAFQPFMDTQEALKRHEASEPKPPQPQPPN